jgi:hypothetical protein
LPLPNPPFPSFSLSLVLCSAPCSCICLEPLSPQVLDGKAGRSNSSVLIAVPRRQRPGWDGCRNRDDGNLLLSQELQYIKPYARADHAGVYVPQTGEILIYGGKAYLAEQPRSNKVTWPYKVADDMWYYNFNHCVNNCSLHGDCKLGFCEVWPLLCPSLALYFVSRSLLCSLSYPVSPRFSARSLLCQCYVGYYGVDCSNTSCPGTFCYYDADTHDQAPLPPSLSSSPLCLMLPPPLISSPPQVCTHACQAAYNHTDDDVYIPNMRKVSPPPLLLLHLLPMTSGLSLLFSSLASPPLCSTLLCRLPVLKIFQERAMVSVMAMATPTVLLHSSLKIALSKIARTTALSMAIALWSSLSADASAILSVPSPSSPPHAWLPHGMA